MQLIDTAKGIIPYVLFIGIGCVLFPSSGRDDAYITYWTAYSLANFGEIVNYNGERVEQGSSLLHTLLLALIYKLSQINIPTLGTLMSVFFGLVTIFLTGRLSKLLGQNKNLSQLIVATSVPLLYWSFGGLEASLVSVAILWLVITTIQLSAHQSTKNYLASIIAVTVYLLLRPEAFFITLCFLSIIIIVLYFRKQIFHPYLNIVFSVIILFTIITLVRYSYFGSFFPQPVEAKVGMSIVEKLQLGMIYYQKSVIQYPVLILLFIPLLVISFNPKKYFENQRVLIVISLIYSYALFIFMVGGDWMEGARFFVPMVSPLIAIAIYVYHNMMKEIIIMFCGVVFNSLSLTYFALNFSTGYPIFYHAERAKNLPETKQFLLVETANSVHYRDIPLVINLENILEKMIAQNIYPTILSAQAGMVPFYVFQKYYKNVKFVDLRALTTKHFAECPVTNILPRAAYGISTSYDFFFRNIEIMEKKCGIKKPDIIYEVDPTKIKLESIKPHGYTIVYLQTENLNYRSSFKGTWVRGVQFIAVNNEVANQINLKNITYEF